MSEHAIELVSVHGELSPRLVCHAAKGAPCRMRPADLDVEEWSIPYEGDMVDTDCWAVEWQSAAGFVDGIRAEVNGVWATIPVVIGYDEGVLVSPAIEQTELDGIEVPVDPALDTGCEGCQ